MLKVIMSGAVISVAILFLAIGALLELLTYYIPFFWAHRSLTGLIALVVSVFATLLLVISYPGFFLMLFGLVMIYRIINQLRLIENRLQQDYLKKSNLRSFYYIFGIQVFILVIWWQADVYQNIPNSYIFYTYSSIVLISSLILLFTTMFNIQNSKPTTKIKHLSDDQLPSITLAIPARNETHVLNECLELALKSDYPKLEIIVLDDCSQDKTAEVIKSFAHQGVRFVQGSQPATGWLAKNSAYQTLLDQSSGELILYMGVDVRLSEKSIRQIVEQMHVLDVDMMSILPKRLKSGFVAAFIQPMRYWWELAVPKIIQKRPPALSSCWIVSKQSLINNGGFKALAKSITPEEHLAKKYNINKRYAFLRTNLYLNLTTQKNFTSQWSTAVRTKYPQAHRRPEVVALRTVISLTFIIAPFIILPLIPLVTSANLFVDLQIIVACLILVFGHTLISLYTNPISAFLAPFNFPIVMVVDLIATHISMYRYEFGEVIWKGRDVTEESTMQVIAHLPTLPE